MKEIWKDIEGYKGIYQVSNLGRVKGLNRVVKKTNGQRVIKEKLLNPALNNRGYYTVCLCKNGKQKVCTVHRLILIAFMPNPKNKEYVNHIDGIKVNNILINLDWCTAKENHEHAAKNGLIARGDNHYRSKLNERDVIYIRQSVKHNTHTKVFLSKKYNVSSATISSVVDRKNWAWLK